LLVQVVRSQRIVVEYDLKIWLLGTCQIWLIDLNIIFTWDKVANSVLRQIFLNATKVAGLFIEDISFRIR